MTDAGINHIDASRSAKRRTLFVIGLAAWMITVSGLVLVLLWKNEVQRAVIGMAWGVILLWVCACGLIMWRWRDMWRRLSSLLHMPWMLKFILGCTALALTEEMITTLMTNCAPLFGVQVGQAYITASANYFDVVLYHSVVVFVPLFIGWAFILRWWKFSPFVVFVLFGITGLFMETLSFGLQNLGNFAFWIFVYGLMVWLPAYTIPADRPAGEPPWWGYPLAIFMPLLCLPLVAILAPWIWLTPKHPTIHFLPIGGG